MLKIEHFKKCRIPGCFNFAMGVRELLINGDIVQLKGTEYFCKFHDYMMISHIEDIINTKPENLVDVIQYCIHELMLAIDKNYPPDNETYASMDMNEWLFILAKPKKLCSIDGCFECTILPPTHHYYIMNDSPAISSLTHAKSIYCQEHFDKIVIEMNIPPSKYNINYHVEDWYYILKEEKEDEVVNKIALDYEQIKPGDKFNMPIQIKIHPADLSIDMERVNQLLAQANDKINTIIGLKSEMLESYNKEDK